MKSECLRICRRDASHMEATVIASVAIADVVEAMLGGDKALFACEPDGKRPLSIMFVFLDDRSSSASSPAQASISAFSASGSARSSQRLN